MNKLAPSPKLRHLGAANFLGANTPTFKTLHQVSAVSATCNVATTEHIFFMFFYSLKLLIAKMQKNHEIL